MSDSRQEHTQIVRIQSKRTSEELAEEDTIMGDTSKPKNAINLRPNQRKDLEQLPQEITLAWDKTLKSIFEVGQKLIEAKQELEHGQFKQMVRERLPFSARTAQRFMAIAQDQRLANPDYEDVLPHSWGTLYELTTLKDDVFEEGIKRKIVGPEMTRKNILELKRQLKRERENSKKVECTIEPHIEGRQEEARQETLTNFLSSLDEQLTMLFSKDVFFQDLGADDQWAEAFDKLEKIIPTLDTEEQYTTLDRVQRSLEQAIARMNERAIKIQALRNDIRKQSLRITP